jgi:hypothetical protein
MTSVPIESSSKYTHMPMAQISFVSQPDTIITIDTLTPEQRATAEAIARNAGITDPEILENAILDIALTNAAPEFIQGYVNQQRQATLNGDNTLINPDGVGIDHSLTASAVIPYTIRFANNAEAGTTPVAQVTITQLLDADLDLSTFTLSDFGFGNTTIDIPTGTQNFSQRLDLRTTQGVFVDVNAGLDQSSRVVSWTFTAIDPTTGQPANSAAQGFLPPNDANNAGQGFVGYSIQPLANLANNTRIDAQASITFNSQTPIQTPAVFNTLDSVNESVSIFGSVIFGTEENDIIPVPGDKRYTVIPKGSDDIIQVNSPIHVVTEMPSGGADSIESSVSYNLAGQNYIENLTLTGTDDINGIGNKQANRIQGNSGQNRLTGLQGTDTFVFEFGHSPISAPDKIRDFQLGTETIDILTAGGLVSLNQFSNAGRANPSTIEETEQILAAVFLDADAVTTGLQALGSYSGAFLDITTLEIAQRYLLINDGVAGFQSQSDLVIQI